MATSAPPPPARGARSGDLQRQALGDLVALATECAATEAEIERRYQQALQEAEKQFQNGGWAVEERYKTQRESVRQRYETRLAEIEQRFQAESSATRIADENARQRVDLERKSVERDIKKEFEQASWLAESVFEAAQNKIRDEYKRDQEEVESKVKELDELQERADTVVRNYGHRVPPRPTDEAGAAPPENPDEALAAAREATERHVALLRALRVPALFVGIRPALLVIVIVSAVLLATHAVAQNTPGYWKAIGLAAGITAVFLAISGAVLWAVGKAHVRRICIPLYHALTAARAAAQSKLENAARRRDAETAEATARRDAEIQESREQTAPLLARTLKLRDAAVEQIRAEHAARHGEMEAERERARIDAEQWRQQAMADLEQRHEREANALRERYETQMRDNQRTYEEARAALERRLEEGLLRIHAPVAGAAASGREQPFAWNDPAWDSWQPPRSFATAVRFGELEVDLKQIAARVPHTAQPRLHLPESFRVPAALKFPQQASLLIHTDRNGRETAIQTLQMVMARLLTSLPPGRVRFTLIDPVGLGQSFAGFMHLADHDEALVGGRILTETQQIEQRLADLTEHMETVIQKYLRNEFETIDDYNAQAGELAEPYRFVVIADFPAGLDGEAARRLSSIVSTGARCGVHTLIVRDTRQPGPAGMHLEELEAHSVNLAQEEGRFFWKDDVLQQFPLRLDPPPDDQSLTHILDLVGRYAKDASRVEVPFDAIAPGPERIWIAGSADELRVPIGRMGATGIQSLRLGRGVAQHALIAGKTGSGKSTLLHVLITNLALWYSPDEVEFYLVDFKKGVEFKTYATHDLPHARAIAVESDREFGLSVLQRLDAELTRRGELFRKAGVQDLSSYRQSPGAQVMPRTLLIVDEFQEFFSEDDKLGQDAALLLDRLVRQGRAFGIHVLLGSQTIGGTSGLSRSTVGQIAIRIALQTSEADSHIILGDGNSAARLLTRPGEAIYNDAGGRVEANSPFQVSWLPDDQRERYLARIRNQHEKQPPRRAAAPAIVFEGNAPADVRKNQPLASLVESPAPASPPPAALAYLGEPVAIKAPTAAAVRRQAGANLLIVGQQDEAALAMMSIAAISLAAQHPPQGARFYLLDGTPADSPLAGRLPALAALIPHDVHLVDYRAVPEAMAEIADEMSRRQAVHESRPPATYVLIYGLQRYRALRKQEEAFAFGAADEEKAPQPDRLFADTLRDGPPLGIHVLAWIDTPAGLERTLDRGSLREFDHRVLFQMSATDSSNLIDSPMANKLGLHRALAYSEEQGIMEKFRPYALPDAEWLDHVRSHFASRAPVP